MQVSYEEKINNLLHSYEEGPGYEKESIAEILLYKVSHPFYDLIVHVHIRVKYLQEEEK